MRTPLIAIAISFGAALFIQLSAAQAAMDPDLSSAVHHLESEWERIKFSIPEGSTQTQQMNALGEEADKTAARFPNHVAAMIWDGIITSERASLANPLSALGLAKRARDILEAANKIDPVALDAGAPTSLGVLYYRVPGFPIGFGDKKRARQLLEQATKLSPQGMDAWYFYGDFLMAQDEVPQAVEAFRHALNIPRNANRPLWDDNRRLLIQQILSKITKKS